MPLLEIACFTPESAILASQAGADRIELCENREAGGTTPTLEALRRVKQHVTIPVFLMIRPRGGDFNYSDAEFDGMLEDVSSFKPMVDGFVFGVLDIANDVDIARTTELVRMAAPLPCTFHRAFDEARDMLQALEDVVSCGCKNILTSGGLPDAAAGMSMLRKLVKSAGERIQVVVGGGVRASNIIELLEGTGALAYHSSAIKGDSMCTEVDVGETRDLKRLISGAPT